MAHSLASLTWHFSPQGQAKDKPVIVLLHNFGGTEDSFTRHVHLLNELSYDVVTFDLSWHRHGPRKIFKKLIRSEWRDEVVGALREVLQERPVITFAFSGPSFCMIDAAAEILPKKPEAIKAMIFDSGPFENYHQCIKNMLGMFYQWHSKLLVDSVAAFLMMVWDPLSSLHTHEKFQRIFAAKPQLPFLSLQGAQDRVVPMTYIQTCFKKSPPPNFTEVIFQNGGHLTSLKEEPEKYKQTLQKFLSGL